MEKLQVPKVYTLCELFLSCQKVELKIIHGESMQL